MESMNMYLHCHLSECIKEYGPTYGFWLFSFERYNGMLGKFPNNQKHIEVQPLPQVFHDKFYHLIQGVTGDVFNNNHVHRSGLDSITCQIVISRKTILLCINL